MRKIKGYLNEWRVQEYLLIAFFISWLSWGILILLTALNIVQFQSFIGLLLFGIGGFGPTFSAVLCLDGKLTLRKIGKFIFQHQKRTWFYLVLFAILALLTTGLSSMETNSAMPWYSLPVVFLVCTLIGGGNEELGWRGTLQPLLERVIGERIKNRTLSFVITSLVVGIIWAIWHLPLWFVSGSTQQGISFGWFALAAILLSFWLGCIYRRTSSVFYCMLFHGFMNLVDSYFILKVNWIIIAGYTIITLVAIILAGKAKDRPAQEKLSHGNS